MSFLKTVQGEKGQNISLCFYLIKYFSFVFRLEAM